MTEVDTAAPDEHRARLRGILRRIANVFLAASVLSLPVAVLRPNGWGPTIVFTGFVLYLLISHLRRELDPALTLQADTTTPAGTGSSTRS